MKSLRRDTKGVVYVEFLLVFPPLLLLFLFILQSAIIRATDIGVRHAASATVRSAIVVLPDDPIAYGGQNQNQLVTAPKCSDGFVSKFKSVMNKLGTSSDAPPERGKCPGGPRLEAIRFAAVMRMLPFSPNPKSILPRSLHGGLDATGTAGWLAGAAVYSYGATAVTFLEAEDSTERKDNGNQKGNKKRTEKKSLKWNHEEPVTVRVSYLAHCGIPIARFFMCDSSHSLHAGKNVELRKRDLKGKHAVNRRVQETKPTIDSMKKSVGDRYVFTALLLSGERYVVLSADATLPLNSAPYTYQAKGK